MNIGLWPCMMNLISLKGVKFSKTNIIGTKWVLKDKLDEHGFITMNKAKLVAKDYNQQKGIDFGETYAPIAILEVVRFCLHFLVL